MEVLIIEVLIKYYNKPPELPVIVEHWTTKDGYSCFMIKYRIPKEFIENHRVLFDPYMHKALSHVKYPSTFHIMQR